MTSLLSRIQRKIFRKIQSLSRSYPDWPRLLKKDWSRWQATVKAAQGGPRILIATGVGGHVPGAILDSLLAVALTVRGAEVHILLCDQFLPACEHLTIHSTSDLNSFARHGVSRKICQGCFVEADKMYRSLGIPVHYYSEFITPEEIRNAETVSASMPFDKIRDYCLDGLRVGEHAVAGALRFFARGTLDGEPMAEPVVRHYLRAALLTMYSARRCQRQYRFTRASFHHGIYIPQGVVGEVARQEGLPVVNWNVAYRKKCFIFSHHDTYHHTMLSEPTSTWENITWTGKVETDIMDYLKSRRKGTRDWIWFHNRPQESLDYIAREVGIDFSRPCIGMLTNVMWDAQLHYPANAFANMREWAVQTIRYFAKRPELQLVIRIHPAELRGTVRSRQFMVEEIRHEFPNLPENVFIIPPESEISTYALTLQCNAVIIYGTKTGVELTSMGIPVIVGGEAWIRNKELTMDAHSVEEYFAFLDQLPLPQRLDTATVERARKYAYHFFFRRMIPIACIEPVSGWPPYRVQLSDIDNLWPGRDKGLDTICNGILHGTDFVYPAELYSGIE